MPLPAGAKTGPDYSRLKSSLASSKTQTSNNALYQTILSLIDGVKTFQGFVSSNFNSFSGNLSDLFDTILLIIKELSERNSAKFAGSWQNSAAQVVPDITDTDLEFDTIIFDDGIIQDVGDNTHFIIPATGHWCGLAQVLFDAGTAGDRVAKLQINGTDAGVSSINTDKEIVLPFNLLFYAEKADIITFVAYHDSGANMNITGKAQLFRVTYTE